mmetsp:Transcript_18286/g.25615  ORF Transcript_18286/g.25615 Transcript_18286/m.25615 type:complete len:628 (+) Transcript_18286:2-1885(+)
MTALGIFEFESQNNKIVKAVCFSNDHKSSLRAVIENHGAILMPIGVTIENIEITMDFVESHIVLFNPTNKNHFITINGQVGMIWRESTEPFLALTENSNPKPKITTTYSTLELISILNNSSDAIGTLEGEIKSNNAKKLIHILREGQVPFQFGTSDGRVISIPINLLLISEPALITKAAAPTTPATVVPSTSTPNGNNNSTSDSNTTLRIVTDRPKPKKMISFGEIVKGKEWLNYFSQTAQVVTQLGTTSKSEEPLSPPTNQTSNAFFQKLKSPAAVDVVKLINSFEKDFNQKAVGPKIGMDFQSKKVKRGIEVIMNKIRSHALWKHAMQEELDLAEESLERYICSKLYPNIFTIHCNDLKNAELETQIARNANVITPEYLDVKGDLSQHRSLVELAQKELLKANDYKAPKDKVTCIWNSCKVVYNIVHKISGETAGADEFLPILIYVVVKANPKFLYTTVQYINAFRDQNKLLGESGYYFTQLMAAVAFINNLEVAPETSTASDATDIPRNQSFDEFSLNASNLDAQSTASSLDNFELDMDKVSIGSRDSEQDLIHFDEAEANANSNAPSPRDNTNYSFVNFTADDLKISDIPTLLQQYKQLVRANAALQEENQKLKANLSQGKSQ